MKKDLLTDAHCIIGTQKARSHKMRELLRGAPGARGEATSQVSLQAEAFHQPHADPLLHRARRHATLRQEPQLGPGTINDGAFRL